MQTLSLPNRLNISFKEYLFKDRRNKLMLWICLALMIIQFSIFKYLYPFASFIHGDSFSYLIAADDNLSINTYMVGYSNFLRLFSVLTKSDTALVAFQYIFVQASALFLLFTLFYHLRLGRILQVILLGFSILNPLLLHLANLVASDCLFLGLSLAWFALLLWIFYEPTTRVIFWHVVILFIAFTMRYNALVYPFISAGVILLSKMSRKTKFTNLLLMVLLCGSFIGFTTYKYKELTGYWQYSPFSGWQWANNAMYAYRYVDSADRKPVPKKFQVLDNMIRQYFDSTRDTNKYPVEAMVASTYYMWSPGLPLFKYRNSLYKGDTTSSELKKWASMGPFYKEYGIYIIKHYPTYFARHFIWPNTLKYYAPPIEFLESYNSGRNAVTPIAVRWFNYNNDKVKVRMGDKEVRILNFYPILSGIINVVLLICLISFFILDGHRKKTKFRTAIYLGGTIWLLNAGFTILASSAALRFQSFPILLSTIFSLVLTEWIWQLASSKQPVGNVTGEEVITEDVLKRAIV